MQDASSPLPDWKGEVLADPSWHVGLKNFNLRWVPHTLSINQKREKCHS
jgi:hypothetical protein